jgi:hypothetical protein
MPSFFESVKRIIQGKPVFDDVDAQQKPQQDTSQVPLPTLTPLPQAPQAQPQPPKPQSPIRKGDSSTFPIVQVKHCTSKLNGPNMQVYCRIINNSRMPIDLDKIRILGTTRELDNKLRPGEEREYMVYSGPRLQRQQYNDAQLDYKTEYGDYFKAIHDVRFTYNSDKTYSVDELRLHPPIRDIYG